MSKWNNFLSVPIYLQSTEKQNQAYLASTGQAQIYKRKKPTSQPDIELPDEPIVGYEEPTIGRNSLKRKIGASVLAVATLAVPSSQYGTQMDNQPPKVEVVDNLSSEVCYEILTTVPATDETRTFEIRDAYNDSLSEAGKLVTANQFETSAALTDLQEYVQALPDDAVVTSVEVHATASDDNRSNVEAGIGRADEVNQRTARSYADIATTAVKKLLSGRASKAEFMQTSEETLLTEQEQHVFEDIRRESAMATNADLLTAYNDVRSALGEQSRDKLDGIISEHRGVEITLHAATPEQSTVEASCVSIAEQSSNEPLQDKQPSPNALYVDPVAVIPTWSRLKRARAQKQKDPYERSLKERAKWRAEVVADELKRSVGVLVEDVQFISGGIAKAGRSGTQEVTGLIAKQYNAWVVNEPAKQSAGSEMEYLSFTDTLHPVPQTRRERLLRPFAETASSLKEQTSSVLSSAHGMREKQSYLDRLARIPKQHARTMDPNEFRATYGVFLDEYSEALRSKKSLPLRRLMHKFSKSSKK